MLHIELLLVVNDELTLAVAQLITIRRRAGGSWIADSIFF